MSCHELIDAYRAELARRLPASIADELGDGITETYRRCMDELGDPNQAARQALREFGSVDEIATAFTTAAPGRGIARLLLGTGPAVGAAWAGVLITQHAWEWQIPAAWRLLAGLALLTVVAVLAATARDTTHYTRSRATALTACALILALDTGATATAVILAPLLTWPLALATAASLARITFTLRALPPLWAT